IEGLIRSPSYRPQFKVHWSLSLLGAAACLVIMFLINPAATVAAAVVIGSVFLWLERREMRTAWGDVRRGVLLSLARSVLLRLKEDRPDPRNWRPHVLVLSGAPTSRWHLVQFASDLTHNRALMTVATVLRTDSADARRSAALERTIDEYLERKGVQALVRVVKAGSPFEGAEHLAATYGMGSLVPNTFLLGASEEPRHRDAYCRTLGMLHESRRNVVVLRHDPERGFGDRRRIDVWWGGLQKNGGLMMLLAYLLRTSLDWQGARVRVKLVVPDQGGAAAARANLQTIIESLRIGAEAEVLVGARDRFPEILARGSADADLVFLGLAAPGDVADFTAYYERLQTLAAALPTTAFVLAAEDLDFAEVLT
ncbi:MAG: Na-K-Cl cotransporter, partial [Gemmatimonadetes bacterium]|nr:Na-K-Cl cotransporter [Gemmatimonadota bacterium]NIQ54452.1 Na-K-Cl cotransporter [Gemmatimonadota bacterium]NIU74660.1 Na-K-Cl cotransporter [Gammaproteobacteria bacterium]NIX44591.1 Na-K-Cl cotransporter [Gemmatimonadota bacterium]NIY08801.1 Na-K-Cl cotransporter [Gemmatimonadota bacterium]